MGQRRREVIEALAANSEASINAAVNGWGDTQAAYRFFSNVTSERILEPLRLATVGRMREQPVVLIAQDTTGLDNMDHLARDALCLNSEQRFGVYHHAQLVLTPERLPQDVVATHTCDREPETLGKAPAVEQQQQPIEDKDSFRWLEGYRTACDLAAQCPNTRVISVADRGAGIYDIFLIPHAVRNEAGLKCWKLWVMSVASWGRCLFGILSRQPSMAWQ